MTDQDLKGRVALITGSNKGIGFAIARRLGQMGAAVALNGRTAADALYDYFFTGPDRRLYEPDREGC